jgi:hypothetical protein
MLKAKSVGLMFSGGVDSVVCLSELVKQGITPNLFVFQTWKMKASHLKQIKQNAKRLSPKSQIYVYKPRTIDYIAGWQTIASDKKVYFVHLDEYSDGEFFYPLRLVDQLILGYVDHECKGRRANGELGRAQPQFIKHCIQHNYPIVFPLIGKTTREVDELFNKLPEDIKKNTVSSTRAYKFGGAYLSD